MRWTRRIVLLAGGSPHRLEPAGSEGGNLPGGRAAMPRRMHERSGVTGPTLASRPSPTTSRWKQSPRPARRSFRTRPCGRCITTTAFPGRRRWPMHPSPPGSSESGTTTRAASPRIMWSISPWPRSTRIARAWRRPPERRNAWRCRQELRGVPLDDAKRQDGVPELRPPGREAVQAPLPEPGDRSRPDDVRDFRRWPQFERLYEHVRRAIKKEYPEHSDRHLIRPGRSPGPHEAEAARKLIAQSDYVGISFYPYASCVRREVRRSALPRRQALA